MQQFFFDNLNEKNKMKSIFIIFIRFFNCHKKCSILVLIDSPLHFHRHKIIDLKLMHIFYELKFLI